MQSEDCVGLFLLFIVPGKMVKCLFAICLVMGSIPRNSLSVQTGGMLCTLGPASDPAYIVGALCTRYDLLMMHVDDST